MRLYVRRILIILAAGFFTTLLLLARSTIELAAGRSISATSFPIVRHFTSLKVTNSANDERWAKTAAIQEALNTQSDLNFVSVQRRIDTQLVEELRGYLKSAEHKLNNSIACLHNETLAEYIRRTNRRSVPIHNSWDAFYAQIGSCDLYRNESTIQNLLNDMNQLPITHVAIMEGGTQIKLVLTFSNEMQAVFKPMRFGREYETDPNHFYFGDFERHNAEIATFHLDKILGFRRAVPTVGRIVNITSELRAYAENKLKKTFFISPAKNQCFVGKCDYYCDTTHAICGSPDLKEGSVQIFLPDEEQVPRNHIRSPYRRTYSKRTQLAVWQTDMEYCEWKVKRKSTFAHGRRLLDLVDLHILDYLIRNQDRHHFEVFSVFKHSEAYPIHLDNGRSFGKTKPTDDDVDILLPLVECCIIRPSTLTTLLNYYAGPISLTDALHRSLAKDPVAPLLSYKHFPAIERRLEFILHALLKCLRKSDRVEDVIRWRFDNINISHDMSIESNADSD